MKHKYTATVYLVDGETIINTGDDVDELSAWMNAQAESSFDEMNGEIVDNLTRKIVKQFQYVPPE